MQINNTHPEMVYNQYMTSGEQRIINTVNRLNHTELTLDDLIFTNPSHHLGNHNTKVTIIAKGGSNLEGRFDWYYNRVNISDVFGELVPDLQILPEDQLVSDLLDKLYQRYRILLSASDIHDTHLPKSDDPFLFTLKIKDTSLGWTGSLVINLIPVQATLTGLISQNVDTTINQGEQLDGRTRASIYYGFKRYIDFKEYGSWMTNPPSAGELVDSDRLVGLVKLLFGDKWHWTPLSKSEYNLYGSTIAYFNQNVGNMYLEGDARDMTLAIRLSPNCTNMGGYLLVKFPHFYIQSYIDWLECLENPDNCPEIIPPEGDGTDDTDGEETPPPTTGGDEGEDPTEDPTGAPDDETIPEEPVGEDGDDTPLPPDDDEEPEVDVPVTP